MKEKIRYDLVPAHGIKEISRVLTRKLDTYEENQWKKGMKWTEVLSSLRSISTNLRWEMITLKKDCSI